MENYIVEICMASIAVNAIFCIVTIFRLSHHYRQTHEKFLDNMNDIEESAINSIRDAYRQGISDCMKAVNGNKRGDQ